VARSAAAKKLGIKMDMPWFQIQQMSFPEKVYVFSRNYSLYHSFSQRVMSHLEELSPRVELYSVDETFINISRIGNCMDFKSFSHQLRAHVLKGTGLTIGVAMRPGKVLAKAAQWASKEWPRFKDVLALTPGNPRRIEKLLSLMPVQEAWGCGS
jgi:DNA polymerase V